MLDLQKESKITLWSSESIKVQSITSLLSKQIFLSVEGRNLSGFIIIIILNIIRKESDLTRVKTYGGSFVSVSPTLKSHTSRSTISEDSF